MALQYVQIALAYFLPLNNHNIYPLCKIKRLTKSFPDVSLIMLYKPTTAIINV